MPQNAWFRRACHKHTKCLPHVLPISSAPYSLRLPLLSPPPFTSRQLFTMNLLQSVRLNFFHSLTRVALAPCIHSCSETYKLLLILYTPAQTTSSEHKALHLSTIFQTPPSSIQDGRPQHHEEESDLSNNYSSKPGLVHNFTTPTPTHSQPSPTPSTRAQKRDLQLSLVCRSCSCHFGEQTFLRLHRSLLMAGRRQEGRPPHDREVGALQQGIPRLPLLSIQATKCGHP